MEQLMFTIDSHCLVEQIKTEANINAIRGET